MSSGYNYSGRGEVGTPKGQLRKCYNSTYSGPYILRPPIQAEKV